MSKTICLFFVLSTTAIFFLGACSKIVYTHDVPNLHQVNDSFYRSGQVTTLAGWRYLHDQLGVTDDFKLDFENEGSDDLARVAGITVHVLSIEPSTNPDGVIEVTEAVLMRPAPDRIAELKRLVREVVDDNVTRSRNGQPPRIALIHCKNGHDRTGFAVGLVRAVRDKWPKDKIWREMIAMGYHPIFIGLDEEFHHLDFSNP